MAKKDQQLQMAIDILKVDSQRKYLPNTEELIQIIAAIAEERRNERQRCLHDVEDVPDELLEEVSDEMVKDMASGQPFKRIIAFVVAKTKAEIVMRIAARGEASGAVSARAATSPETLSKKEEG